VLFTDLVGSTELRVRLGEDAADELRRAHDRMLTEAVEQHRGAVVKGLGDGILATFESAADAVAGATAIQQAVDAFGRRNAHLGFAVRVGVSIGDISAEQGDVFGVPVVEASRLCATAGGGEILTADLVRALARGRTTMAFEPMGELDLKGLQEPLAACRVVWEPIVERPARAPEECVPLPPALVGSVTSYIGRDALRDRLRAEWSAARSGACRTILLAGEPGVGKTRTAAELARHAFADGGLVLYGRCDEDLDVPYQSFVEALDYYARHAQAPVLGRMPGELARLVPDLATHVGALPDVVHSDPASEEYRLFEAVASWLVETARAAAGLVLVLDDVHWATKPTLHLMQHVVRFASDEHAPVLVVATYRDTDVDRAHPLASVLADLRRLPGVERLAVDNLSLEEVLALIEEAASIELDDQIKVLATVMYAETEGNPFFVGEVLRHLIETGAVRRDGDRWVVAAADRITIPEGVRDVVGRRLNRLPVVANDVLSVAAVLGRDFDVELLLAVSDATENDALDALDQAVRARLVEETGVDHYRFAHALVRTTLYDELSATRRRRLHRRVADALEKVHPDDVRALAHHCTEAGPDGGDMSRALRYTLAAAEQSLAARAFGDAEAGYRSALELLDDGGHDEAAERAAALCGLGEAQRDQGSSEFRATLLEAGRVALAGGNVPLLQRAVLANTRGFSSIIGGVDPDRVNQLERAAELTDPQPSAVRALLLAHLASELMFGPDRPRVIALADGAATMASELADPALLARVLLMTSYAYSAGPTYQEALARSREVLDLVDATGDPTTRALAGIYRSGALLTIGEFDAAAGELSAGLAIAESESSPLAQWAVRCNANFVVGLAGRLDEAEALNNASLEQANKLGQSDGAEWWAAVYSCLSWLRGTAGSLADAADDLAQRYPLNMGWRTVQTWLLCDAGRHAEARAVLAEYDLDPVDLLAQQWPFMASAQLGWTSWELADVSLAQRVIEALDPYPDLWAHFFLFVMGPVSWPLGMAYATTGEFDRGVELLGDAMARARVQASAPYLALIAVDLATVLLRRDADGDRRRATELLGEARVNAEGVGAFGVVARIDAMQV
jgi:class 3 adenylate cyclase/tetratricopeptide (TPR) repeat protein/DNA polymerase III delta prime subunit